MQLKILKSGYDLHSTYLLIPKTARQNKIHFHVKKCCMRLKKYTPNQLHTISNNRR